MRKRVKAPYYLHWPESVSGANNTARGGAGYVVDWDFPKEREWCKGQEHKLEDAPDDAHPNALGPPAARMAYADWKGMPTAPPAPTPTEIRAESDSAAEPAAEPRKIRPRGGATPTPETTE